VLTELFHLLLCAVICIVGAISGIGGGVMMKPVMDGIGQFPLASIGFLTSCAVLCMAGASLCIAAVSKSEKLKLRRGAGVPLSLGAAVGGVAGKWLFEILCRSYVDETVSIVQAVMLIAINIAVLVCVMKKSKPYSEGVQRLPVCVIIGLALGVTASFLGIGGGPLNVAVLAIFFGMEAKERAMHSLFIIFCAQSAGVLSTVVTGTVPSFDAGVMAAMCIGAVMGAAIGARLSRRMSNKATDLLVVVVMVVLVGINVFNIVGFMGFIAY